MRDLKGIMCVVQTGNLILSPVASWGKELSANRADRMGWDGGAGEPRVSPRLPLSHELPKLGPPQALESLQVSAQDSCVPAWEGLKTEGNAWFWGAPGRSTVKQAEWDQGGPGSFPGVSAGWWGRGEDGLCMGLEQKRANATDTGKDAFWVLRTPG